MLNSLPRRFQSPLLAAFVVGLLAAVAATSLIWRVEQYDLQKTHTTASDVAGTYAALLERNIRNALTATYMLAGLVRQGKGGVPDFEKVATEMLPLYPSISELALAPGGVIRNVAPLSGNETALGFDLLNDPKQKSEAQVARDSGKLTLAGPLNLVQGGTGVVGRLPVFLHDVEEKPYFWGFTLVVVPVSKLLESADVTELVKQGYAYELWRIDPTTGKKQTIAASSSTPLIQPVDQILPVANAVWILSVMPVNGWGNPVALSLEVALGVLFSLLLAYIAKLLVELKGYTQGLESLVEQRTVEVQASEARFRSLTEMSSDFYWESDAEHRLTQRGSAYKKESTVSVFQQGAQIGERRWEIPYLSPDEAGWQAHRAMLDAHIPFRNFVLSRLGTDGNEHFISISGDPVFDATGAFKGYHGVGTDITLRKTAEVKIQRLSQFYAALSQCNEAIVRCASEAELFARICQVAVQFGGMKMAWIGMIDPETRIIHVTARFGDHAEEYLQAIEIPVDSDDPRGRGPTGTAARENRPFWCQDFQNDPRTAPWHERGARFGWSASAALPLRRDGVPAGVLTLYAGEIGAFDEAERNLLVEMATDISFALDNFARDAKRKQTEAALARESHRNRVFLRNASDGVHILDVDGNVLEVSDSFCKMLGYSREELLGANVSLWDAQWPAQELKRMIAEAAAKEGRAVFETRHKRRDGSFLDVEIASQQLELDGKPALFASARDITERIRARRELVESEARFRGLVEQSIAGIYIIQDDKFVYVNPRFAEIRGFDSAEELIGRTPASLVAEKDRSTVEKNNRRLITGETRSIGYSFTALRKDDSEIEVGAHSSGATYRGRPAIIGLLQDISEKKRAEEQIQRYIAQLKTAFMSTVEVATTLSEMRDPYTVGHERRVGNLAAAIGAELGFDQRRIEGLQVAGNLHDIGKITIPAEILSKPGKLTKIEYQLIQGHSQSSYDVLKEVEFPWPVAQIALQHHERMDGSGYPQNLKGESILLESRIMAVADVVEAMSSHRPYRPGLGIDKALAEIERGRGTAYDVNVTDACLRLFREKHYQLPE
jgi:PAS domain S-box-containing protein